MAITSIRIITINTFAATHTSTMSLSITHPCHLICSHMSAIIVSPVYHPPVSTHYTCSATAWHRPPPVTHYLELAGLVYVAAGPWQLKTTHYTASPVVARNSCQPHMTSALLMPPAPPGGLRQPTSTYGCMCRSCSPASRIPRAPCFSLRFCLGNGIVGVEGECLF